MKLHLVFLFLSSWLAVVGWSASAQEATLSTGSVAPEATLDASELRGEFLILPDAERADAITLQYVPDVGGVAEPPETGDIVLHARRTTYSRPSSVEVFNTVYACRTCQEWKRVRHCTDPSRPGSCQDFWVPDGNPTSQCGSAPSWMVAQ